jgi:hypothetical protein
VGASSWLYYVPYQKDIAQAFHNLRQQVFESGEYSPFWCMYESYEAVFAGRDTEDMDQEEFERLLEETEKVQLTQPQTIEELLERNQAQGTHSILDIECIIVDPYYYAAVPLPEEVIMGFYETREPKREIVETIVTQKEVWAPLVRWAGWQLETMETKSGSTTFSPAVLHFFAKERSTQEMIEALLAQDEIWTAIWGWVRYKIETMAATVTHGAALPLSKEALLRYFGTEKPTKELAEATFARDGIWATMRRWVGYYTIIYQDDIPHEIVFAGFSGD